MKIDFFSQTAKPICRMNINQLRHPVMINGKNYNYLLDFLESCPINEKKILFWNSNRLLRTETITSFSIYHSIHFGEDCNCLRFNNTNSPIEYDIDNFYEVLDIFKNGLIEFYQQTPELKKEFCSNLEGIRPELSDDMRQFYESIEGPLLGEYVIK